jgi:hypothetical protein
MPILDQFLVSCFVAIRVYECMYIVTYVHASIPHMEDELLVFPILQGLLLFLKEDHHIRSTVSSISSSAR